MSVTSGTLGGNSTALVLWNLPGRGLGSQLPPILHFVSPCKPNFTLHWQSESQGFMEGHTGRSSRPQKPERQPSCSDPRPHNLRPQQHLSRADKEALSTRTTSLRKLFFMCFVSQSEPRAKRKPQFQQAVSHPAQGVGLTATSQPGSICECPVPGWNHVLGGYSRS